jgi:hypothetical protein
MFSIHGYVPRFGGFGDCLDNLLTIGVCVVGGVFYGIFRLGGFFIRVTVNAVEAGVQAIGSIADKAAVDGVHKAFAEYWMSARSNPKPLIVTNGSITDMCVRLYYGKGENVEPAMTASWLGLPHFLSVSKNWTEPDFIAYASKVNELVVPPNFDGGILVPQGKSVIVLEPPYRLGWKRMVVGARSVLSAQAGGRWGGADPPPRPPRPFPIGPPPPRPPKPVFRRFPPLVPSPAAGIESLPTDRYSKSEISFSFGTAPAVKLAGSHQVAPVVVLY